MDEKKLCCCDCCDRGVDTYDTFDAVERAELDLNEGEGTRVLKARSKRSHFNFAL